jgi:hypothetical protein
MREPVGTVHSRRLRLVGLSAVERWVALVAIVGIAAAAVLVVLTGTHLLDLPISTYAHADIQVVAAVVAVLAMTAGGAALAVAATQSGKRRGGLALAALAVVIVGVSGTLLAGAEFIDSYRQLVPGRSLVPGWLVMVAFAVAWASLACAVGLVVLAVVGRARRGWAAVVLTVFPPIALLVVVTLVASLADAFVPVARAHAPALLAYAQAHPGLLANLKSPPAAVYLSGIALVLSQVIAVRAGLVLWQVFTGVEATRKVASRAARLLVARPPAIAVLLALKLVWLGLGVAGALWAVLGGHTELWGAVRRDGWLSWLVASVYATSLAWWLVCGRRSVRDTALGRASGIIATGIVWPGVVAAALFLVLPGLLGLSADGAVSWTEGAINTLGDQIFPAPRYAIGAAALLAAVLLVRGRARSWTVLVGLFALWGMPRFAASFRHGRGAYVVNLGQVDLLLTLLLGAGMVWAHRQGRRELTMRFVLALVVSGVVSWGGALAYSLIGSFPTVHLIVLFPIAYTLLFGARSLNQHSTERPGRVLATLGIAAVALAVVSYQLALRQPVDEYSTLINTLVTPAIAATLVAATITTWRGDHHRHDTDRAQRPKAPSSETVEG